MLGGEDYILSQRSGVAEDLFKGDVLGVDADVAGVSFHQTHLKTLGSLPEGLHPPPRFLQVRREVEGSPGGCAEGGRRWGSRHISSHGSSLVPAGPAAGRWVDAAAAIASQHAARRQISLIQPL